MAHEDGLTVIDGAEPYKTPQPLTGNMCLEQARRVRGSLSHFGVQLPEGSDLLRMLRSLETLGKYGDRAFWDAGLSESEKRDSRYIEQISGFADVLEALQSSRLTGDLSEQLKHLRKRLDSLLSTRATAQDFLAELEVAATLLRGGLAVTIAEPDLRVTGLSGKVSTIGMPVKRPQSVKSSLRSLDEAWRQARACGLPSVTVLSMDSIVNSQADGRPWEFWSETREGLGTGSTNRFRGFVKEIEKLVRFRTHPEVIGIVYMAKIPGSVVPSDGASRPSYARDVRVNVALNREHWDGHNGTLMELMHVFKKGLPG